MGVGLSVGEGETMGEGDGEIIVVGVAGILGIVQGEQRGG